MPDPTVCAIMITRDRPDYARRAVECFRSQTHENKRLLIYDTGEPFMVEIKGDGITHRVNDCYRNTPIGALRNAAISVCREDIIVHFDDDDHSHANRIAEQVALLQASGADCVGYREMLFWRESHQEQIAEVPGPLGMHPMFQLLPGEAYLYSNPNPSYCLGTSLCYWRKTWERNPFSERNGPNPRERGEDREFLRGIKSVGIGSITEPYASELSHDYRAQLAQSNPRYEPRMIARIHAGNAKHYEVASAGTSNSWRRASEWDTRVREIMNGGQG